MFASIFYDVVSINWLTVGVAVVIAIGLVLQFLAWRRKGYHVGRAFRFFLSTLWLLATVLTALALISAAALKTTPLAGRLLKFDPRYSLAMDGFNTLKDLKYPLKQRNPSNNSEETIMIGVLEIDQPAWPVILDFVKSETAVRKSDRNEPTVPAVASSNHSAPANAEAGTAPNSDPGQATQGVPEINFNRIKTIVCAYAPVATAGPKPLAPPYHLIIFWGGPRRIYEFISLEEFRLDLIDMIRDEMEEFSLWIAVVAFALTVPLDALRRLARPETT